MKKILVVISILLVVFSFKVNVVSAKEVNVVVENIDNIYGFHYRNGVLYSYGRVPFRYVDGNIAYCVEPGVGIHTNTYYENEDFSITGYSDEVKKEMELISYYGYGYRGHDSINYYLATQELIWLYSEDDYITFNLGSEEYDEKIDVSKEKEEIMWLVNSHNKKPSFYNEENITDSGNIKLIDNNNVLDMYDIEYDDAIKVEKSGNELSISANNIGEYEIRFKKIRSSFEKTIVYVNDNYWTQTMAIFKEPVIEDFSVKVRFDKVDVKVIKKDIDTNEIITDKGNSIKVFDIDNNKYIDDTYEFDEGTLNILLKEGNYKIEEISSSYGYSINEEGLNISINNNDNLNREIVFNNKKAKCEIVVITSDINASFEVYDLDNNLVYKGNTDGGKLSFYLEYGDYILKEISVPNGYKLNSEEIKFSVNDISCNSRFNIENEKVIMPVTSTTYTSTIYFGLISLVEMILYGIYKKIN